MDTPLRDHHEGESPDQQQEQRPHAWDSSFSIFSSHLRNRQEHVSSLPANSAVTDNDDNDVSRGASTANRLHAGAAMASFTYDKDVTHMDTSEANPLGHGTSSPSRRSSSSSVLNESDDTSQPSALPSSSSTATTRAINTTTTTTTTTITTTTTAAATTTNDNTDHPTDTVKDSATGHDKEQATSSSTTSTKTMTMDSEQNAEFSCNICFDTSVSPVLTLCGHLFCWSCLHQWLDSQRQNPTCPVCKAGCEQNKVIPIYGRGKEQVDPRSTAPKRPAGQRPEPLRNPNQTGFTLGAGQVTFTGTMIPPFMFSPFGIQYGGSYTANLGPNGAAQTPMQAYVSRLFFMLGTLILVGILLY
ncbi:hypothetical protein BGZ79_003399 [Entomortierella chlamydospora]|nr:hypothetical protein BGZ79_003399 [Entomortierella chlamydospora]